MTSLPFIGARSEAFFKLNLPATIVFSCSYTVKIGCLRQVATLPASRIV
jgi:hypothetical protein